jgi:hypothetical protein
LHNSSARVSPGSCADVVWQEMCSSARWNVYWIPTVTNNNDVGFNTGLRQ